MKYELKNWGAGVPYRKQPKKAISVTIMLSLIGFFSLYLFKYTQIHHRVIIFFPEQILIISLVFSVFIAFIFTFRPKSLVNKTIKTKVMRSLYQFFVITLLCCFMAISLFEYYVYLFPTETNTYLTNYKITISGPSMGKLGSCSKGIKIRDQYTSKILFICFNEKKSSGYNTHALVTVQRNALGSYLVDYDISKQNQ